MRGVTFLGERKLQLMEFPDPAPGPHDVVVEIKASGMCGSDLKFYRATGGAASLGLGKVSGPVIAGHEPCGVVAALGSAVGERTARIGDRVMVHHYAGCGTCPHCRNGVTTSCAQGSFWGAPDRRGVLADGAQADQVRVPLADGTLVRVGVPVDDQLTPDLLALSDVMGTGHHAAASAGVKPGCSVVVVGDGAVGLCAVLASARLGAGRVSSSFGHEGIRAIHHQEDRWDRSCNVRFTPRGRR